MATITLPATGHTEAPTSAFLKHIFPKLNFFGNEEEVLHIKVDLRMHSPSLGEHALIQIPNHNS